MSRPQISYICSTFNSEQFIDGFLDNLLFQDVDDFEIIVVDSASTDATCAIAESWVMKDSRVKVIKQSKRTPYGVSWLEGWRESKGMIVANSNSDDRSYQWRTRKVLDTVKARGIVRSIRTPAFYYGGYETRVDGVVRAQGIPPPFSVDDMSQFFRCGVHIHWDSDRLGGVASWEKMFQAANEYKSAFDYWLVLYFISLGAEGVPIPSCFSIYNQRSNSLEQSDKERNTFESLRAIEEFFPDGPSITALETETKIKSPEFYERYRAFCKQF